MKKRNLVLCGLLSLTLAAQLIIPASAGESASQAETELANGGMTEGASGREMGIMAGANVVMPNLSPTAIRPSYALYDGKVSSNAEAAEGINELETQLSSIGYHINWDRGDYKITN